MLNTEYDYHDDDDFDQEDQDRDLEDSFCSTLPGDHWVVILMDPDEDDWSPWSVRAPDKAAAIKQASKDWRRWARTRDDPEVIKVYRNSWIGVIA